MLLAKLIRKYYQRWRIYVFKVLSDNNNIHGTPIIHQPVIFKGHGKIIIGSNVHFGYNPSPGFYEKAIYIEARHPESVIKIESNVYINNGSKIICDRTSIHLGSDLLIGTDVEIIDSDFHGIHPDKRRVEGYLCAPVLIKDNVFIGSNAKILKGVTIGKNSVVANGSIVIKDIPENTIAAGTPAKAIKSVFE